MAGGLGWVAYNDPGFNPSVFILIFDVAEICLLSDA
jgi:hypothetical protein